MPSSFDYKEEYFQLIEKIVRKSREYYRDRLISFAVFGSVVRDVFRPDSDIDILIIAEGLPSKRWQRTSEFIENVEKDLSGDIQRLHDKGIYPSLSPVIKSKEEVNYGSPLFLDMTEDVKILYDEADFFKDYIKGLKQRLNKLGAKKIVHKDGYYWDLKPDYRFGDVIEL